jgi:hypothetical protein
MHQNEKEILSAEIKLALRNFLRYFDAQHHPELIQSSDKS